MKRWTSWFVWMLLLPVVGGWPLQAEVPGVRLPEYESITLDNGLHLILAEKHDVPLVAVHLRIASGDVADAAGKGGSAEILAELLQKGAGDRSALEFSQEIDSVGGRMNVSSSSEALSINAEFMSRDRGLMLELLADMLLRPTLAADEFDKIRQRSIQSIAAAKDNRPSAIIRAYFLGFLFAGHPYGRVSDETSLAALEHKDVVAYFRHHVGADRTVMAFVGDFDAAEMRAEVERAFADWGKASSSIPKVGRSVAHQGRRVLLVDKPGATQTFFWIGNVGVARDDADRVTLDLANTAFGGRFTSMLNTELRIKSGLTYGARSSLVRRRTPGAFAISSFTKTESTAEAIDMALDVLDTLHGEGLSEETLASVKAYVAGQFPPRLETGTQLAARLSEIAFYGLDRSDVDDYGAQVMAASAGDVREVIGRVYPNRENLTFVLIGNAEAIREAAARYGEVTEMSITDKSFSPPS